MALLYISFHFQSSSFILIICHLLFLQTETIWYRDKFMNTELLKISQLRLSESHD